MLHTKGSMRSLAVKEFERERTKPRGFPAFLERSNCLKATELRRLHEKLLFPDVRGKHVASPITPNFNSS